MSTVLSTVVAYVPHGESGVKRPSWPALEEFELQGPTTNSLPPVDDPELRLPNRGSLAIMIATNALLSFAFFVTVSSAALYAESLGGSALFSGLTIGIPTVFSGIALIPLTRYDGGRYSLALKVAYLSLFLGSILHAMAYRAHFLYLILLGRIVSGLGFTGFMYIKRYCSDPRIIGIRRRTMLASWLVLGQAFGFSLGPFVGGLLYKVGFSNQSRMVTSFITVFFTIASLYLFEDLPKPHRFFSSNSPELGAGTTPTSASPARAEVPAEQYGIRQLSRQQWGVIISMCWSSMSFFFILASWESNIPIFTAVAFNYTPYAAGNFIALGGITTVPFLLASVRYSPRFQDRATLATGSAIGLAGLVMTLVLLATDRVVFGSFYVCWVLVALGFNLASTCTLSLLSKQLPDEWNSRTSVAIQYSNYCGRVTGAILGGAGVQMGMKNYIAVQISIIGVGVFLHLTLWKQLKAKTG
ncbi:membrane transporter [Mycena leptocephala]|nr:membrane transporter [Mycena leptocephala]KAJ7887169.1 membrane transporter [Mycena leptocephala]